MKSLVKLVDKLKLSNGTFTAAYALLRIGRGKALCTNSVEPRVEFKTSGYRIFCKKFTPVWSSRIQVRETLVAYQNTKPLVICRIPVINNILWKCPKNSNDKKPSDQKPQNVRGQQNSQPSQPRNR